MAFMDIYLDLQILICTYLHPSDILTLRKTCKTLQLVTRQRTIWVDALRRVCLQNALFLPSFPILDMSDVELEQAAFAPRRWIELSTSLSTRGVIDSQARLSPTAMKIIDDPFPGQYISRLTLVPGGRYLVGFSPNGPVVWDLGYTPSVDCKLIASVEFEGSSFYDVVHPTPDGMGLVILSFRLTGHCSCYEIYPQGENPQLTRIASIDLPPAHRSPVYSSPDKMIWVNQHTQGTMFIVWDYRLNASVSFAVLVDVKKFGYNAKVIATQTAIVVLHEEAIFIWATPPLLPQPPNFDDYSFNPSPPVIRIQFPDVLLFSPTHPAWRTLFSWYFDPSKPLYFDKICTGRSRRFKLFIEPDLSDATLHLINTTQLAIHDYQWDTAFQSRLCDDTLVYNWEFSGQYKIYTRSTLSGSTLHGNPSMNEISLALNRSRAVSICPASGRLIHLSDEHGTGKIVVFDLLRHRRL